MENRYKNINIISYVSGEIEIQKTRYQDNCYHPYDYIYKTKLKEKTNNIR